MTLGVTIGRIGSNWEVLVGPDVGFADQRRGFHELCDAKRGTHDEVQLLSSSSGRVKRRKLKKDAPVQAVDSKESTPQAPVDGDEESNENNQLI